MVTEFIKGRRSASLTSAICWTSELYRKNLKNRESDKEEPKNLHLERTALLKGKSRVKMQILRQPRRRHKLILQVLSV
jgi:hypothetical protein